MILDKGGFFVQRNRKHAEALLELCMERFPSWETGDTYFHAKDARARLRNSGERYLRAKYRNPIVLWVLLNLVLPAVIQLLVKWWMESPKLRFAYLCEWRTNGFRT